MTAKGKVIVSINDAPEMRQAFKGFTQRPLTTKYTVGSKASSRTTKTELLVRNWYRVVADFKLEVLRLWARGCLFATAR